MLRSLEIKYILYTLYLVNNNTKQQFVALFSCLPNLAFFDRFGHKD